MIELLNNQLTFPFPEVHQKAAWSIDFQRTLRTPDDNRPPGLVGSRWSPWMTLQISSDILTWSARFSHVS